MWTAGKRCPGSEVALVCGCLFVRGNADSFAPSHICRPPPITPSPPLLCSTCGLQLGPRTSRTRCLQMSSRRRKRGRSERGRESLDDADWWTAGGGFRGPCLPVFIRDLAKISRFSNHLSRFPGPPLCHPVTVTLFLSHLPSPLLISFSSLCACVLYSTLLNDKP